MCGFGLLDSTVPGKVHLIRPDATDVTGCVLCYQMRGSWAIQFPYIVSLAWMYLPLYFIKGHSFVPYKKCRMRLTFTRFAFLLWIVTLVVMVKSFSGCGAGLFGAIIAVIIDAFLIHSLASSPPRKNHGRIHNIRFSVLLQRLLCAATRSQPRIPFFCLLCSWLPFVMRAARCFLSVSISMPSTILAGLFVPFAEYLASVPCVRFSRNCQVLRSRQGRSRHPATSLNVLCGLRPAHQASLPM